MLISIFFAFQESAQQSNYANRWLTTDPAVRDRIKQESLTTLGSNSSKAGAVAAQIISAIAAVELPSDQWPDLIGQLLGFVNMLCLAILCLLLVIVLPFLITWNGMCFPSSELVSIRLQVLVLVSAE